MVPAPVGMNSVEFKDDPLACMMDGATSAVRSARLPTRRSPIWANARKAGAEVRAWSTVTRILTNQAGTRVTGVEYYDDKQQKQTQEASVVLLAAWSAQKFRGCC